LKAVSKFINNSNCQFLNSDFESVLSDVPKNGFVYLDPPYDPISNSSSFTGYTMEGFNKEDQIRLKMKCDELTSK
jgi:DNA adenine methylase